MSDISLEATVPDYKIERGERGYEQIIAIKPPLKPSDRTELNNHFSAMGLSGVVESPAAVDIEPYIGEQHTEISFTELAKQAGKGLVVNPEGVLRVIVEVLREGDTTVEVDYSNKNIDAGKYLFDGYSKFAA